MVRLPKANTAQSCVRLAAFASNDTAKVVLGGQVRPHLEFVHQTIASAIIYSHSIYIVIHLWSPFNPIKYNTSQDYLRIVCHGLYIARDLEQKKRNIFK